MLSYWVEEKVPQVCLHFPKCNEIKQLAHSCNISYKQKHKQNMNVVTRVLPSDTEALLPSLWASHLYFWDGGVLIAAGFFLLLMILGSPAYPALDWDSHSDEISKGPCEGGFSGRNRALVFLIRIQYQRGKRHLIYS